MSEKTYKALVVRETDGKGFVREIAWKGLHELPPGELLVNVKYSSLNYKDTLSATGHKGVTKKYPHTPGIDAAGVVQESASGRFAPGDEVIVSGFDLGMNTPGGYGQYIRVPASWAVRLPERLTMRESMIYGTAGFTAALSIYRLEKGGVRPEHGEVLVTGATGGVGSLAVGMLAREGYRVVAATAKPDERDFLLSLGAREVIKRDEVDDPSGKPLLKERWAGVVDSVGGNVLVTAIKSAKYGGVVTCCGLLASHELNTTVYPFILRGVSLLGVESAVCPMDLRREIWRRIAGQWKLDNLDAIASECSLEELDGRIKAMIEGKSRGRVVVNLGP